MAEDQGAKKADGEPSPPGSTRARARTGARSRLPLERLQVVEKMLIAPACMPHRKVERELAKRWKVTRRTVREYIRRVYDDWASAADDNREHARARIQSAFEEVYQRAMKLNDLSAANAALERMGKLAAAFPTETLQIGGHLTATAEVLHGDPEKDRARLEELRQREAERKGGGK